MIPDSSPSGTGKGLADAPGSLCRLLPKASVSSQKEILHVLADLKEEAGAMVLPLLSVPHYPHVEVTLEVLTLWKDPRIGPTKPEWALQRVPMVRRAQNRTRRARRIAPAEK